MEEFFSRPLDTIIQEVLAFIPRLILAIAIFLLALWLANWVGKLIQRAARRRDVDPELQLLFGRIARWTVIIVGTVVALQQVRFNVAAFLGGLGIVGFTVGFALKDIAENFVAGVLLLWQQPFDIGDAIQVQDYSGTVSEVSLRATEIRTFDGLMVFIPNAIVYGNPLTNFSKLPQRRVGLEVGVAYGTDLNQATRVTLEAISQLPGVILEDPVPAVVFSGFGESSIDFTLYYWVDTNTTSYFAAQDLGVKAINDAFIQAGIDIPFPVRNVILQQA
jgi:small-conductance mechanosensitive channel